MSEGQLVAGRYRVITPLGRGGMGVVWLAYDERLHRKVAVKQLLMPAELTVQQAEQAGRQAMREGRIAAKLQHPHLVTVYDVVEADGQAYLIMEYVPSTSLSQVLAERGALPPAEVARVGRQAAAALAAAHAGGVVHRDVKPGNVLLSDDGTVKITDFGVSRAVESVTATTTGMIAGTPAYLSPEVAQGRPATFASDVFSLGATLYAATEGTPPFGSSDNAMALLHRVASGQVVPPTRAGPLTGALQRMLTADPTRRPTMTEVGDLLAAATTPIGTDDAPPVDVPTRRDTRALGAPPGGTRRRRMLIAAAAVALLAVASIVLTVVSNRAEPGSGVAAPPTSAAPTTAAPTATAAPSTTTGAGTAQPTTTRPASTSAGPAAAPQSPPEVITGYYALMPGDLEQAWNWLTPKYQRSPAGGYGGYQTFWGRIRTVRTSDVTALPGDAVEATVEYAFADGRVVVERHRYRLIRQDGGWKIDESAVLSSVTR